MASSLEDLLKQEGFKGKRLVTRRRSFQAEGSSIREYSPRVRRNANSSSGVSFRTERSQSDATQHARRDGSPGNNDAISRLTDDSVRRGKGIGESRFRSNSGRERRYSGNLHAARLSNIDAPKENEENEIVVVADAEENGIFKDIYSDGRRSSHSGESTEKGRQLNDVNIYKTRDGSSKRVSSVDSHVQILKQPEDIYSDGRRSSHSGESTEKRRQRKDMNTYKTDDGSSSRVSSVDSHVQILKQPEDEFETSIRGLHNGKAQSQNAIDFSLPVLHPALDEVAVKAMVSILGSYTNRFLKDDEFMTTLHHSCFSSLNFIGLENQTVESKIITNLVQAIDTVEQAAEGYTSVKELKKASLKLSVITGLNSNHFKDGFTSGVPNSKLSACAHLYLSIVYKLQRKDRVSARHLLQVFCDSPFQARTKLLPELWDSVFYPHVSHLKVWYSQEVDFLSDAAKRGRKLKLLEKIYNESLDSGTYQLAAYYRDWLNEGIEAPPFPSIKVPTTFVGAIQQAELVADSPKVVNQVTKFSPQPMVSKKLYEDVFGRSNHTGTLSGPPSQTGTEDELDSESRGSSTYQRSSHGGSPVDIKQEIAFSINAIKYSYKEVFLESEQKDVYFDKCGISSIMEDEQRLLGLAELAGKDILDSGDSLYTSNILDADVKNHVDTASTSQYCPDFEECSSSQEIGLSMQEMHGYHELCDEIPTPSRMPQEFLCPLTGELLEYPVTLETGKTFEQAAIKEWFDQGQILCPVTGKLLVYLSVPAVNSVLKHTIDRWKSDNSIKTLEAASHKCGVINSDDTAVFILENIFTSFSGNDRKRHIKRLISFGGLEFCIHKLKSGKTEAKACAAALLVLSIEADSSCRNKIVRDIDMQCLLDLLSSKQAKLRENAILLLYELICLSRKEIILHRLNGLKKEEIKKTLKILLVYLQSASPDQVPLVATLLLRLDLLVNLRSSIYKDKAVDALSTAISNSFDNEFIRERCCRTLLILGGQFSSSGKVLTETWILKKAGLKINPDRSVLGSAVEDFVHVTAKLDGEGDNDDGEENDSDEWLRNLSAALLGCGQKSFLDAISKCLRSQNSDLVEACLITVEWISSALPTLPDAEYQLSAFASLISHLKENLENGKTVELKVLASLSLLNFSKISECRVLLMTIAEEIAGPLKTLASLTWSANELYNIVSGEDM